MYFFYFVLAKAKRFLHVSDLLFNIREQLGNIFRRTIRESVRDINKLKICSNIIPLCNYLFKILKFCSHSLLPFSTCHPCSNIISFFIVECILKMGSTLFHVAQNTTPSQSCAMTSHTIRAQRTDHHHPGQQSCLVSYVSLKRVSFHFAILMILFPVVETSHLQQHYCHLSFLCLL